MKWFNNLKVAKKIVISCMVFVVLIGIISLQGIKSMKTAEEHFMTFYSDRFIPVIDLNQMAKNNLQVRINMLQEKLAVELNNPEEFNARLQQSNQLRDENAKIWEKYMATTLTEEEARLAESYHKHYLNFTEIAKEFVDALKKNDIEGSGEISQRWVAEYNLAKGDMNSIIELQNNIGKELMEEQEAAMRNTFITSLTLLAVSVLMTLIITIVLTRAVSGPVNKGLSFAQKLADGDLTQRIDLDQNDELGKLGGALNTAADNLEDLISNVYVSSQNLVQAVNQITSGNQNLSQRTSEQASALEEVASTIEESTATIKQNADNAQDANSKSSNTNVLAKEGGEVTTDAISAINEINESSKKIGEIISVINEISFQTNLLALNAAVEAARAGEQGRGFAVVAGEVRNLAQRSSSAAKEIEGLIKDTLEKVNNGTELSGKSGEALESIIESVRAVNQLVSEIAAASEEQKQGMEQINNAITEMDNMTQQNASLVEETAAASEEMSNQAQELMVMVSKFKVTTDAENEKKKANRKIHLSANDDKKKSSDNGNGNGKVDKKEEFVDSIHAAITADNSNNGNGQLGSRMKDEGFEEF